MDEKKVIKGEFRVIEKFESIIVQKYVDWEKGVKPDMAWCDLFELETRGELCSEPGIYKTARNAIFLTTKHYSKWLQ